MRPRGRGGKRREGEGREGKGWGGEGRATGLPGSHTSPGLGLRWAGGAAWAKQLGPLSPHRCPVWGDRRPATDVTPVTTNSYCHMGSLGCGCWGVWAGGPQDLEPRDPRGQPWPEPGPVTSGFSAAATDPGTPRVADSPPGPASGSGRSRAARASRRAPARVALSASAAGPSLPSPSKCQRGNERPGRRVSPATYQITSSLISRESRRHGHAAPARSPRQGGIRSSGRCCVNRTACWVRPRVRVRVRGPGIGPGDDSALAFVSASSPPRGGGGADREGHSLPGAASPPPGSTAATAVSFGQ